MSVLYWSFISAKTYYVYLVYNFAFKDTGDSLTPNDSINKYIYSYNKVICFSRLFIPHSTPLHRQERQSGRLETEV